MLASVPLPLLMPLMVDEVLLNQPGTIVAVLKSILPQNWQGPVYFISTVLIVTLLLRLLSIILNVLHGRLFTKISKDVVFRIRTGLIRRLRSISMAEYETLGSGTIITYMVTDLDTVDDFISNTISRFIVACLMIVGTACILFWMHWQLALLILFLNPLVIFFTMSMSKHVKELKKRQNHAYSLFQQSLTDTLEAIHQIRSSNRESHYLAQLIRSAGQVKSQTINFTWKSDAASKLSHMVLLFGFDFFRAVAMLMVLYSGLSIGKMLAVFGYLWFMMAPVQELLNIQYAYFSANAALQRLNEMFELQDEPQYPQLENPFVSPNTDNPAIGIELYDVYFAYGSGPNILNGISLSIRPGEKIALVGASGGGKSTLISVLIGLYPLTSGSIHYNGVPVTRIGLDVVRHHVATVLQHPALFNDTIRANLTMGEKHTEQKLWHALHIAQLDNVVKLLPDGLDTIVGRFGMRLSGGQRQRLAIARMILRDPEVVILDEATSALDTETEQALHDELEKFLYGRTTIIVAHRLSAVRQADQVYVFEDGSICEQGNHQQLIEKNGLYARLYGEPQQVLT
ncbi:MAG: ABC transporter ATP-binding protein/permease [Gammaproteobacteria bacterium]|nr:ABC transporter ATP-binding protein/permease [Gammaproteobacteria bacterium]